MAKMVAIADELCIHGHRSVVIVEDRLGMVECHQVVVLDVSGIVKWHCA